MRARKYRIVCRLTAAEMQDAVEHYLRRGWKLHGPTFFANAGYRQVVVLGKKRPKDKPYLIPRVPPVVD